MAKGSAVHVGTPFNEVVNSDPNSPDVKGDGLYFDGWSEINKMHLSTDGASMIESDNSMASHGIFGGPNPGEENPAGMSTNGRSGGKK